jgi:hypothetical protein
MTNYGKPKKIKKDPNNIKGRGIPPNVTVSWGRGASEYRPGLFTKQYFEKHGETCAADIYYALSREIERLNEGRIEIGEKPFQRPNYSSFSRYFWWFVLLGLIEPVDRYEAAIYPFLRQRHFYRLTGKGRTEVRGWEDPISVRHPEFR